MFFCPYCSYEFKTMPQRKMKCPGCIQYIYVKSTPNDRNKRIMTDEEVKRAEEAWELYNIRQKFLSVLFPFGLTEQDIENERVHGFKSDFQAVVSLLSQVIKKSSSLHHKKMASGILAVYAEEEGNPFLEYLFDANRYELQRYKEQGIKKVEILTSGPENACVECQKNEG